MPSDAGDQLRAFQDGERDEPEWEPDEAAHTPRTRLCFTEERCHPEQVPLLRIANSGEDGEPNVGEVWLYPADLPGLVALLSEQLARLRRRPGEGPVVQLDLYRQPPAPSQRRARAVRQYYGPIPPDQPGARA